MSSSCVIQESQTAHVCFDYIGDIGVYRQIFFCDRPFVSEARHSFGGCVDDKLFREVRLRGELIV